MKHIKDVKTIDKTYYKTAMQNMSRNIQMEERIGLENRRVIKNDNSETLATPGTKKQNEDKQSKKREHRKLTL
jgi:hypothetical protein